MTVVVTNPIDIHLILWREPVLTLIKKSIARGGEDIVIICVYFSIWSSGDLTFLRTFPIRYLAVGICIITPISKYPTILGGFLLNTVN